MRKSEFSLILKGPNPFLTPFSIVLKGPNPYDIGSKSEKKVLTYSVLYCKVLSASVQFFSSPEQFEKRGLGSFSLSPTILLDYIIRLFYFFNDL